MKTEDLLNLDFRKEETKTIFNKALTKIKSLEKYSGAEIPFNALEKVLNLRGVYYDKVDELEKGRRAGVIAQEIQEVLPEVVTYAEDIDEYGVQYGNITAVLIEAIKEQQTQIEELKELVKQLTQK